MSDPQPARLKERPARAEPLQPDNPTTRAWVMMPRKPRRIRPTARLPNHRIAASTVAIKVPMHSEM